MRWAWQGETQDPLRSVDPVGPRRRSLAAAVFALAAAWQIAALVPARAEQMLRIIIAGNYPPFIFTDATGALTGFEIDLTNALCAVIAMRCEYTDTPFEETIPSLIAGRGDAIVASMSITEERKKLVAFTDRYYRTPIEFAAIRGFERPVTPEGLRGLRIGVERATTSETYLRTSGFADRSHLDLFDAQADVNQALVDGHDDLIIADTFGMWKFLKSTDGQRFAAIGGPIYVDEGIGIAVRREDEALRKRLNLAIARLRLDGTYEKIVAKYFPFSIY